MYWQTNKSGNKDTSRKPSSHNEEEIHLSTIIPNPYSTHSVASMENMESEIKKPYDSFL